ncbi:hypothetical protein, partial [Streptomyces sp. NPDC007070]|uniref:hypothetical protein n=1 Tax=Streptomyces sp. NPDC007070 TaxID=3154312 RepID=UPI0033D6D263
QNDALEGNRWVFADKAATHPAHAATGVGMRWPPGVGMRWPRFEVAVPRTGRADVRPGPSAQWRI